MYATLVAVKIDLSRREEAEKALREEVVPRVKSAPGFVSGYWFEPDGDNGYSVLLWDTKEQAEAAAAMVPPGSHPSEPVTVQMVQVREVVAQG